MTARTALSSGVLPSAPLGRSVLLSSSLLQERRAGAVLAVSEAAIGRSWSLSSTAPTVTLHVGLRADEHGGEGEGPEAPEVELEAAPGSAVAVLEICGPIAEREAEEMCGYVQGYDGIAARFRAAVSDPAVAGVVLRFISAPGGDVAGLEDGVASMRADAARFGKPVFASVSFAASAACWIAQSVATAGVYVTGSGAIGSVGVIAVHVSEARALDAAGLDVTIVRDPAGKAAGHPAELLSDLARRRITEAVRDASGRFFAATSAARGLSVAAVSAQDAAMFTGPAAVRAGMADGVATFEEVLRMAARGRGALAPAGATAAALAPRRNHMDQAVIGALLGLSAGASEDEVMGRARALSAFTDEAVRLSGEADAGKALGALRAHVERSKRAGEIEAKAQASHIAASLGAALADRRITPAEVEDLQSWGGKLGPEALDSYLGKRTPMAAAVFTEPEAPPAGGGEALGAGPEKHDGKTYADMTSAERSALFGKDINKAKRMRAAALTGKA